MIHVCSSCQMSFEEKETDLVRICGDIEVYDSTETNGRYYKLQRIIKCPFCGYKQMLTRITKEECDRYQSLLDNNIQYDYRSYKDKTHEKIVKLMPGDCIICATAQRDSETGYEINCGDVLVVKDIYKHYITAHIPGDPIFILTPDEFEFLPKKRMEDLPVAVGDKVKLKRTITYAGGTTILKGSIIEVREIMRFSILGIVLVCADYSYKMVCVTSDDIELMPQRISKNDRPHIEAKSLQGTIVNGECIISVPIDVPLDNKSNNSKEESEMSMANELNKMFGAIQPGMCRLSMNGGVAVKTSSGYKSYNMKTGRLVNCDNFALDPGSEWFFCIPTNHVKTGDIILINGKPCCVKAADKDQLTVINYENNTVETVLPERHMFMGNMYFYSKVVSPFNSSSKKGGGVKKLMKYAMMSEMLKGGGMGSMFGGNTNGNNNNGGGMNPMMAMMMFGGGGFGDMFDGMFDEDEDDDFGLLSGMFEEEDDEEESPKPKKKKKGAKSLPAAKMEKETIDESDEEDED